jgi:hypothetical protein
MKRTAQVKVQGRRECGMWGPSQDRGLLLEHNCGHPLQVSHLYLLLQTDKQPVIGTTFAS